MGPSTADRRPFLQLPAGSFKFFGDEFFVRKDSLILGAPFSVHSDLQVLARLHPVFAVIVELEVPQSINYGTASDHGLRVLEPSVFSAGGSG